MRYQFSLRTVAIFVTVFCCLLAICPVRVGSTSRVTGVWIQSPRFWPPSQVMVGFVRERMTANWEAYYVAVWLYEGTSVPFAVVYVYDSLPAGVSQNGFQIQTMRFPLTRGWKIALSIAAGLLFVWYPVVLWRKLFGEYQTITTWWGFRFIIGLAATDAVACCLLNFAFQR